MLLQKFERISPCQFYIMGESRKKYADFSRDIRNVGHAARPTIDKFNK